jgi:hypothetical protein
MSVISTLGRLRQEDCRFEASLDYTENSSPACAASQTQSQKTNNKTNHMNVLGIREKGIKI